MNDSTLKTIEHIRIVQYFLGLVINELKNRSWLHDKTKLEGPEAEIFDKFTPLLGKTTYGSKEYEEFLKKMKPVLDHHYKHNSHHPESKKNGIYDMTLIDLIEMICDWRASCERHKDGNILRSIEINQKRFGYSDGLKNILLNTVKFFDGNKNIL